MSEENKQGQEESPPQKQPMKPEQVGAEAQQDKPDERKAKPAGEAKGESAGETPPEPKEGGEQEKPEEPQAPAAKGAEPDDSEQEAEAPAQADQEDKISKLTEPERLRRATSEARESIAVRRQFATSSHRGMSVERDVHVSGDLIMQLGLEAAARRDAEEQTPTNKAVPVSDDERRRIQYVYQQPKAYHRCHARLLERHVVILLGQARAGKRATAIRLAMDMLGSTADATMEYGRDVHLLSVTRQPNTAYLVDGFSAEQTRSLQPTDLRGIAVDLESVGSYLILCADPIARPHEDIVREFGIRLEPPGVSTFLLLERHLAYYGGDKFELKEIQIFLKSPELEPVLRQPLSPQGVDDLSRRLIRALRGDLELTEALEGYVANLEGQVMEWFEEAGENIQERAFRIALAAFNGARYIAVQEAAKDLAERLQPPLPEDPEKSPPPPPSPFAESLGSRLKRARAHLGWAPEPGSALPGSRIEVVKLDDEDYARNLLRYVWSEYPSLRGEILAWLSSYAVGHTADVRMRAAGAIGALASQDLPTIRNRVLVPWIYQDDRQYRAAIGKALGVLVWNEQQSPTVMALLDEWSNRRDQRFRWAAARAYGDVGLYDSRGAMEQWRKILISAEDEFELLITEDWHLIPYPRLHMSILDTIVNFFLAAVEEPPERFREIYEGALQELKRWCDLDRKEKKQYQGTALGLPIFTLLANVYFGEPGVESDPDTWPPPMLLLVDGESSISPYRVTLAELFRRALNWRATQDDALYAIKNWLARTDHDVRLEAPMIVLLRDIAFGEGATARDQRRLSAYLRRWAWHPRDAIESAGRAREELFS